MGSSALKPPVRAAVKHHGMSHPHLMGHRGGNENRERKSKSGAGAVGHVG